MQTINESLVFSATDLSSFLGCGHQNLLDRNAAFGGPRPPRYDDPGLEALRRRGLEHEQAYLTRLRADGRDIREIPEPDASADVLERWRARAAGTEAALRAGAGVIYQGALFDGTWLGRPDFLERVERPSLLGEWSYDVVDTKLAREAKGGALLQVLLYADLLAQVQGVAPEFVHLELGGPEPRRETFRVAEYAAYYRSVKARFLRHVGEASNEPPYAPEPVAHCDICAWRARCDAERRDRDHLSLVAGISRRQRLALEGRGVGTVEALGGLELPADPPLDGVSRVALERVRNQARIQVRERRTGRPEHELLLPIVAGQGLAALPAPSPGDLFFDLEGDPYALGHGLEYLFGFVDRDGAFTGWWALSRAEEKAAFERFIDLVMERLDRWPDMHIYHFAPYEPTAFKKLMGYHATREEEVDRLLRGGVLVDLHRVVKGGLRASVESYSIKKLERFYGYTRAVDLRAASAALAHFEAWLELGGARDDEAASDDLKDRVEGYNRDDCLSTLRLAEWLETLRDDAEHATGEAVPRPEPGGSDPPVSTAEALEQVAALVASLTADVPADPEQRTEEQHARWLLAQLLGFHRREKKATWWEYFRCLDLSDEELIEDRATLGGLEYQGVVDTIKRSEVHRYRFPPQDHGLRVGLAVKDPATKGSPGEIVALDESARTLDLKRGKASRAPHPRALVALDDVNDGVLRQSLLRLAATVLEHGLDDANPHGAAVDLLTRRPPRTTGGSAGRLMRPGETPLDAGRRLVILLDSTVLPIQGPPGAGKTFTAARMIVDALAAGKRVGVTAHSHKVIANLMTEICTAASEAGVTVRGIQKANESQWCGQANIEATGSNARVAEALRSGEAMLAAGTAWLWSREEMVASVDLLVVDEAGQISLAAALAVAPAADSLVLVGDPKQLEQPLQGVHPPGSAVSALEHLLGDAPTIGADRGLFLAETWRLNPELCAFTSEVFYGGQLRSRGGLERQVIRGTGALDGSGVRLVPVDHEGNQSESPEEVDVVAQLVDRILGGEWVDDEDKHRELTIEDILIVAPYNAQVSAILARLPDGARVGTVDKFQGQEAPIVIYSMATSTPEDAPRGMQFLYRPNRFNVATSRAKCVAAVVASPRLFTPDCRTPEQMRLANAFCRYVEMAGGLQ